MSTVQPTDKVLVNRAGTDYSAPADMSTVQDTDLLLINRAGVDYKCTFLDWKNSQIKAPDVGTVTLSDVAGGDRFTSTAFPVVATMVEDGLPKSNKKLKAYVEGALKTAVTQGPITAVTALPAVQYGNYLSSSNGWSQADRGGGKAFDGSLTTVANSKSGGVLTFSPPSLIKVASSLRFYGTVHNMALTINGVTEAITWINNGWASVSFVGDMSGFTIQGNSNGAYLYAVEVDGVILTPRAETQLTMWTTVGMSVFASGDVISEVQSDGTAGDATGTIGSVDATAHTIRLSASTGTWDVGNSVKSAPKAVSVVSTTTDVITDVAPPSTVYTLSPSLVAVTGVITPGRPAENAFDGSLATLCSTNQVSSGLSELQLDIGQAIPLGSLRLCGQTQHGLDFDLSVDGGPYHRWPGGIPPLGSPAPRQLTQPADISWLPATGRKLNIRSLNKDGVYISAMEVFGVILVAHVPIKVGPTVLTFASDKGLVNFAVGDPVVQQGGGTASGKVLAVDATAKTISVTSSATVWGPANAGRYLAGPAQIVPTPNVKLYCKLDAVGAVSDLQSADPGFTTWTPTGTGPYTGSVTFPATLPSGQPPDTDLPAGTTLTVEVEASNTSGADSAKSNTITPA